MCTTPYTGLQSVVNRFGSGLGWVAGGSRYLQRRYDEVGVGTMIAPGEFGDGHGLSARGALEVQFDSIWLHLSKGNSYTEIAYSHHKVLVSFFFQQL